ncbi:MAG: protoporphyrinogen oxidase [Deltaproteobacteria bacterium]|nr:protoporphyrinogen oxidase [Deltaproteobacteria bacterium]
MRIAVLGAGISGLAAAHSLASRAEVVVFEARDRAGGNIHTGDLDGCRVEWGPNGFLDNEPATLELVTELGLTARLQPADGAAARRFLWREGRLREIPSKPQGFLASSCLPLAARLRALAEPFVRSKSVGDESVFEFARRRLGRGIAETLVDGMVTGVFAGDPRRLSVAAAFPRLHALEAEHGSLIRGARGRGFGPVGHLTSFDDGLQVLVEALTRRLDVRFGTVVDDLSELLAEGFDHVLCTLPATRAADLVTGELGSLLRRISTAPVVVVALVFEASAPVPQAFGFLSPHGQGLEILGALCDSAIFPGRAPAGKHLVRVLIGGRRNAAAVELQDHRLIDLAFANLERAWGPLPAPTAHGVFRHRLGIAQYERGHSSLLREIESRCPPHLRLAGSSYRGLALNACVREARSWAPWELERP